MEVKGTGPLAPEPAGGPSLPEPLGPLGEEPPGATPLDDDDVEGLLQSWVSTLGDLNIAEGENILRAQIWLTRTRRVRYWYLATDGLRLLHRQMFGDVWRWAGDLRLRETTIGADPRYIPVRLRDMQDDVMAQIGDGRTLAYPADELAIRFHHRLVTIHPFRNGNGRHARLAADLLNADLGGTPFSWGGAGLTNASQRRRDYIDALRETDRSGEVLRLLEFARRN